MKKFTRPRGTADVLPGESEKWQLMEAAVREVAGCFGFGEIRLPTFEDTSVFVRVGETTDIVTKEMYTFETKGGQSVTLRPEGTSGVVRAVLENGMLAACPLPLKLYYIQSCFRYEKMQKGRLREFHQFGVECFGTHAAPSDAEVIAVADALLVKLGVREGVALQINSIGCPACRPAYHEKLVAYFTARKDQLCETCLERLTKNPMRILDCKNESCIQVAKDAPVMLDSLCGECADHFEEVKALLDEGGVAYVINPRIVRGLDYYTNTVFEFVTGSIGAQGAVCAGGRYDGLVEQFGGQPTPGVGFGLGLERLLLLMEAMDVMPDVTEGPHLYAVGMGAEGGAAARSIVAALRAAGVRAECDVAARSLKAQMKAANRLGAQFTCVLGADEVAAGAARVKRMADGAEAEMRVGAADPVVALYEATKAMPELVEGENSNG